MKIQLKIDHKDHGDMELVTRPADLLKWERLSKRKLTDLATKKGDEILVHIGIEDLMIMAYAVLSRAGDTKDNFEVWSDGLNDIEMMELDDSANPPESGV